MKSGTQRFLREYNNFLQKRFYWAEDDVSRAIINIVREAKKSTRIILPTIRTAEWRLLKKPGV